MKNIIIALGFLIISISGCLSWYPIEYNTIPSSIANYDATESINFNASDLFEFSIYEEMSYNLDLEDDTKISDFAFRSFKQKNKANDPSKVIVEKSFLYLDGLSEDAEYGRSMYMLTQPMISRERKIKYFNNPLELQTTCLREVKVGYWIKLDTILNDRENSFALFFKNNKKTFSMLGEHVTDSLGLLRDRVEINFISNPSEFKHENRINDSATQGYIPSKNSYIDLRNTVGFSKNEGLYFIQSNENLKFKRSIHTETSTKNHFLTDIDTIAINEKKHELYLIPKSPDTLGYRMYTFKQNEIFKELSGHYALKAYLQLTENQKTTIDKAIHEIKVKEGKQDFTDFN